MNRKKALQITITFFATMALNSQAQTEIFPKSLLEPTSSKARLQTVEFTDSTINTKTLGRNGKIVQRETKIGQTVITGNVIQFDFTTSKSNARRNYKDLPGKGKCTARDKRTTTPTNSARRCVLVHKLPHNNKHIVSEIYIDDDNKVTHYLGSSLPVLSPDDRTQEMLDASRNKLATIKKEYKGNRNARTWKAELKAASGNGSVLIGRNGPGSR